MPIDGTVGKVHKLNPEIKARWVTALRSGNFEQLPGSLAEAGTNKRCCLGVLCDIAAEDNIVHKIEFYDIRVIDGPDDLDETQVSGYRSLKENEEYNTSVLPYSVQKWAGTRDVIPFIPLTHETLDLIRPWTTDYEWARLCEGETTHLASLNDRGVPFSVIADLIEEYL